MEQKEEASASFSGLKTMQLNDQKAGMEGLNKDEINKIIYEASKGTPYFAFQEKRQKSIDFKVQELQKEMKNITEADKRKFLEKMDRLCKMLESERDLNHSIVHIDMDAFYAAVEMRDNPELRDRPMAVGSSSMLSTSNYHARKYGVRAAMPGFIAKKLCPELIIVPCNFDKYRSVSHEIRNIVAEYDPHYSAASLDEVYLDLTDYIKNQHKKKLHEENCLKNDMGDNFYDENENNDSTNDYNNCMRCVESISNESRDKIAYHIVEEIRQRIYDVTQLTASAGIAPNTMLAKVCSDQNKPNGQYQISSMTEAVKSFIATLPVKKVSGIGPVQGQILNSIGILTCADMWSKRDLVASLFSQNSVEFYMEVALGIGNTTVKSEHKRKSIGNEQTFKEIYQPEDLHKKCEELCNDLVDDLKTRNLLGKVIVLKIKTTNFETHTRNHSLHYYTSDPEVIFSVAKKLLDTEIAAMAPQPLKLRLMGVRMCNLMHEDSIPSSTKQHITLKNFLQSKKDSLKTPSELTPFEEPHLSIPFPIRMEQSTCPVCLEQHETSFIDFNDHVHNCMKNHNFVEERKEPQTIVYNSVLDNPSLVKNEMYVTKSDYMDYSVVLHKVTYSCPVCGLSTGITNLMELNIHVDQCLNKQTIKEILADDLQVTLKRKIHKPKKSSKRMKVSRKERRIEEYFQ